MNIVFVGDFRQLDPVKKQPLYKDQDKTFENYINCFLELVGQHRFKKDPDWGKLLSKFRSGTITEHDIKCLNDKIWIGPRENLQAETGRSNLPNNIRYATYKNADRDSINAALFEKAVMNSSDPDFGLLVFASKQKIKDSTRKYSALNNWGILWENATESGIKFSSSSKRMDPVLKLYRGMRVMLTENKDVLKGIANGTQATVEHVVLKRNESYGETELKGGSVRQPATYKVKAALAHQLDYIQLRHVNDNMKPAVFRMKPQEFTFKTEVPSCLDFQHRHAKDWVSMKATQLPIICNDATTGHKLQGSSVEDLFVHEWSHTCKNWIYVVLSRVRTLSGLFCRDRVPSNLELYAIPEELKGMMERMQKKRPNSEYVRHTLLEKEPATIYWRRTRQSCQKKM